MESQPKLEQMRKQDRVIGLGCAALGNQYREYTEDEVWALLDAAWELGIRHFDTAPHYGIGLSERRLGAFLQTKPRDEFTISTKAGRLLVENPDYQPGDLDAEESFMVPATVVRQWDFTAEGVRRSLEESLERLGLDRVDTLYLHDPERGGHLDTAVAEGMPALAELKAAGTLTHVGVGSMVPSALTAIASTGLADDLMVAGRYTLAEQPVIPETWDAVARAGAKVTVASVFNSGILTATRGASSARYDYADAPRELLDHVEAIREVCDRHGVELPVAALHYPLRDELVGTLVLGTGRASQLRQNVEWLDTPVPDALWTDLHDAGLIPN